MENRGLVVKAQSGFFTVKTEDGSIVCQLRGKLKQGKATGDIAALGDKVQITILMDGSGVIEEVDERKQAIVRLDPRLPLSWDRAVLEQAQVLMQDFAGKGYRSDLLPLYPLGKEIRYRLFGKIP